MRKRFKRLKNAGLSRRQRAVKRLLTLPPGVLRALNGGSVVVAGQRLDPALAVLCRFANRRARLHRLEPAAARRRLRGLSALMPTALPLMDRVEDRRIPGPGGPLAIRVYTPADLRRRPPALVYFHGGGWVVGDLESSDAFCRLIAGQIPCRVISVDYRLAPEHPYPAAVEDAVASFRWSWRHADELGV
ncbi:MAG: alpha/beta hydrolase, partial [Acidobacteriota bacterium]